MSEKGYVGKISNSGSMKVEAPHKPAGKKGTAAVKKGDDLRK